MYISLGALIAIAWLTFCLMPTIDEWISDRREIKELDRDNKRLRAAFNKNHHYDERHQRWVRNVDGAIFSVGLDGETYYIAPSANRQLSADV
jgi:hypothetical protein